MMDANGPTTALKNFTTLKNTRANSARVTLIVLTPAITVICAPLPTSKRKLRWISCISLHCIRLATRGGSLQTSTCSILRQYGARIATLRMLVMHVCTLTTGRTSGANRILLTTTESNAPSGKPKTSSKVTRTGAETSTGADTRTDGRNRNITH